MGKLVDTQQMSFIKGRQIMDAILIANECVDARMKSKDPGIMCKLDIEKAYDHLNWEFLPGVLLKMGFDDRWISWIKFCISTVKFSILINGSPVGFFSSQRAISGLHINWNRSFIYPINEVMKIHSLVSTLGGRVGVLPTVYLGMPLGAKSKSKGIWNGVVDKCEKKLVSWKSQYLYLGGRVTLINSVLDAMPTYMMSLFPMHAPVKKARFTRWDILTTSKKEGGKGIRNLKIQNQGLMMKWLRRFATAEQSLWKNVIEGKPVEIHQKSMAEVQKKSSLKVGNGMKTSFWEDKWLGQRILKQLFPDIYNLNQQQGSSVGEL
ncbi:PREDICTED: uncharacterized protein LOC109233777 [Nicotiana attenuata]|uniref:uncharacterized protein LOC109233777 n=1 Tax=Nicotiana attenuata TaxID=49451 RepID=UPI000904E04D|nr:PREDICTED: uncharacterized protein LOC109233777 [Nicotiana attenuata]